MITALNSLNPDSASLNFFEPSPASSTYFSNGHTAVSTPSPAKNNNCILPIEAPLEGQQFTEATELDSDIIKRNPASEIHRSNYKAPTVEEFTEIDESPAINRPPPNKLNPEAAPFVFPQTSTHKFFTPTDKSCSKSISKDLNIAILC